MASEGEESLIKRRMGYNELPIRNFILKSQEYLNNWSELTTDQWDESVTNLLCEIDLFETLVTKMENQNLVGDLDSQCNQDLISQIQRDIESARQIIELKEKEYKDVQKVKGCKEQFENIAKEINTYPRVERIESKVLIMLMNLFTFMLFMNI